MGIGLLAMLAAAGCERSRSDKDASVSAPSVVALPSAPPAGSDPAPAASGSAETISAAAALGSASAGVAPASVPSGDVAEPDADAGPVKAFRKANVDAAELAKIIAAVPELARIGEGVRTFNAGDVNTITSRSGAAHEGVTFTTSPIVWSPRAGVEIFVATGRSKSMSFVIALWPLPGGKYSFASSFLMLHDLSPVALAYDPTHRRELRWTSCWGCPGEQGFVSYRAEERRVVIVQQ